MMSTRRLSKAMSSNSPVLGRQTKTTLLESKSFESCNDQKIIPTTSNKNIKILPNNQISSSSSNNITLQRWQRAASRLLRQNTSSSVSEIKMTTPPSTPRLGVTKCESVATDINVDERPETNVNYLRRKCDEWLQSGLPKIPQFQTSIDTDKDLSINKEWQPYLTEQARSISVKIRF
ncbi:unnamed protein product [Didymodactylos carnosus]|uniref:Uncharacterized protein n=1 Tax=Didymodactylos carnosus TaxID=1234261 RepID=A0A8S2HJG6_9BILA|nr:unnamed protein product [Didymodactylos carnosus]CAF3652013.1 unnamed protein product [Didymodactylos carnosus]